MYRNRQLRKHRRELPQGTRRAVIGAAMLLGLILAGGAVYTWLVGRDEPAITAVPEPVTGPLQATAPVPDENAVVGVAVQSLASPVPPGSNTTIYVRTNAKADCTIEVTANGKPFADSGLIPKTADRYGTISWSWTVPPSASAGTWPVKVSCKNATKAGVVSADLVVAPE